MIEQQNDVRVEVTVRAPIERAFAVFTERGTAWWPYRLGEDRQAEVVLEPHRGGRWYERATDGTECDWGRVLTWDPPKHVVLSWQLGVGFVPQDDPELASRVEVWFVADSSDRTTVTLVHSEFERHGEGWESMRDGVGHESGWPGLLRGYAELAAQAG